MSTGKRIVMVGRHSKLKSYSAGLGEKYPQSTIFLHLRWLTAIWGLVGENIQTGNFMSLDRHRSEGISDRMNQPEQTD